MPGKELDKSDLALTMVVSRASLRQAQGRLCPRIGAAKPALSEAEGMAATQKTAIAGAEPLAIPPEPSVSS